MHTRLPVIAALALAAAPAAAQHPDPYDRDPRLVIREAVKDVVRGLRPIGDNARAYQGRDRGPEQTERFTRKVKIGRDGRFTLSNIAGNITVTGGSGDEVSIDAVKRTRGDAGQLATVHVLVEERGGRVDVRTDHTARNDRVSVDYTVAVPASAAVDVKSISGNVKVTGVHGAVRAETISGNVTTASTPRVELAKSVSGDVELSDASVDSELTASTISGNIRARGLKARALDVGSISGDIVLSDVACDRVGAKSVSGNVEYSGALARNGRYDFNAHSGNVRLALAGSTGFDIDANTFSGSIRSDLPITIGPTTARGERRRFGPGRSIRGVFGDGSAALTVRSFSGDIIITKR
jgi:DUF4097 and DUF4098 domain-containing protein YvlB